MKIMWKLEKNWRIAVIFQILYFVKVFYCQSFYCTVSDNQIEKHLDGTLYAEPEITIWNWSAIP